MRLLTIEDDSRLTSFMERAFKAAGYQVAVAFDGPLGIEMAERESYDLVLLDVMLPGMNGIEVCRRLRGNGIRTPIVMLTGKDSVDDKVKGFEAGADDYVTKPFAFEELIARIEAAVRRGNGDNKELLPIREVANLILDKSAHEVRRDGRLLELTPTEFRLLEYLMRSVNRVVSRAVIEQQVWGYQHDPLTNVVDVYIRRLRKKIDDDFEPRLIHTVRGIGYRLKGP